jgi:glycosyltransferase involved in cell wall biosynthesis
MKIALILTQSLDSPSGLGRYGPIARQLVRLGCQVEIIALHYAWDQLQPKQFTDHGVRVQYVGQMHVRKTGSRKYYFSPRQLLLISLVATLRLTVAVANSESEIIHLGKAQPFNSLAARWGARGRRVYCDCDDYETETNRFSQKWQQRVVRYFEDSIVNHVRALTVNTRFTQKRYQQLGFPPERIAYIPNGIERARFELQQQPTALRQKWGIAPETPLVMYVGSLGLASHPVDLLIRAFPKVAQECPKARLMLVGGGEDFDSLQAETRSLGLGDQVIFTGRVSPEKVATYLAIATLSVDPVYDNPTARARSPLKIVESLAMGVPVVTGNVGDRPFLLANGEMGVITEPGSSEALAEGIIALVKDADMRTKMSNSAFENRENWYWERLINDFVKVYQI